MANNEVKLTRKQIRDAAKKKARTKKNIMKALLTVVVSLVLVAAIGVGIFFASYDPLGDNVKASVKGVFSLPYTGSGANDLKDINSVFPLDQAAFFYFLNNYSENMTEECCMEIKDSVKLWNIWNRQTEYSVVPNEFAYKTSGETSGYFETLLDIKKDGEVVDTVLMAGLFSYDPATNLITDINIDTEALVDLGDAYDRNVLGKNTETESEAAE